MSQCKNRIGERCKLNGEICPHLVDDGKCENADVTSIGKATFAQALGIITDHAILTKRNQIARAFHVVVAHAGLEMDDPCETLTYDRAERFAKSSAAQFQPSTAKNLLKTVYLSANNAYRAAFKALGVSKPVFDRYSIAVPKKKIPTLTWDQKNEIVYHMECLRRTALDESAGPRARRNARNEFIVLWWGRWFGVRTQDAVAMKWRNISSFNDIPHILYTPHKTARHGTEVCWPIGEEAYNQILPFVGQPDEDCASVKWNGTARRKHGLCAGRHHALVNRINAYFRSIGCDGWAAFYNLRYWSAQDAYAKDGALAESLKHGHTQSVARAHYYNANDHRMRI